MSRFARTFVLPFFVLSIFLAGLSAGVGSAGEVYPTRPITVINTWGAGMSDTVARIICKIAEKDLGQPVMVEDKPGAGGAIGANYALKAKPDGYMLGVPMTSAYIVLPHLRNLQYDPLTDTIDITTIFKYNFGLAVKADGPWKTFEEVIDYARKNPGKITYASPGVGTVGHLAAKQLEILAGIEMTTVPYKGLAPALNDILGGHVDLIFDTGTTSLPMHTSKKINIIATGSAERWPSLPDVPTIAESGLPGFRAVTWYAIVAPPGTPADIAAKISKDVAAVVKESETADNIKSRLQMDPIGSTNAEAAKLFADDSKLWSKVISEAKISLD